MYNELLKILQPGHRLQADSLTVLGLTRPPNQAGMCTASAGVAVLLGLLRWPLPRTECIDGCGLNMLRQVDDVDGSLDVG